MSQSKDASAARSEAARSEAARATIELPGINPLGGPLRAAAILTAFLGLTLPLMPVQYALIRLAPRLARKLPYWYHRQVCRLLGIKTTVSGEIARDRPVLVVANHVSWLDIPVLSAVAPLSFIAKKEVGTWPFVASLSRLQRTVYVDRTRRAAVGQVASEMSRRLASGDVLVLFAEGTSTDGNRVLPFKTALLAPAFTEGSDQLVVQTLSLAYTRLHGIPLGRADRSLVGWYGDMEMTSHAWALLKAGPLDARIVIGEPIPIAAFDGRKALAVHAEQAVRREVVAALRGRAPSPPPPADSQDHCQDQGQESS